MSLPALRQEPVILLDQSFDAANPADRLTVTGTLCGYYRRGFIDIYLPRWACLAGVVGNQEFDDTSAEFIKREAQQLFDDLLTRLIEQCQREGRPYAGQRIIHFS